MGHTFEWLGQFIVSCSDCNNLCTFEIFFAVSLKWSPPSTGIHLDGANNLFHKPVKICMYV